MPDTHRCEKSPTKKHSPDWDTVYVAWDGQEYLDVLCKWCGSSGCVDLVEKLTENICWSEDTGVYKQPRDDCDC